MSAVVVLGAGVDAFVAAHCLKKAGQDVTLVRESSVASDSDVGWVPPAVVRELDLERYGFHVQRPDVWARAPLDDGSALDLTNDVERCSGAIRRLSERDAARWPEFCVRMHTLAGVLAASYCAPPPDPLSKDVSDLLVFARTALRVRRLGRGTMEDLLRLLPMSVADLLDEWFESDVLKGALGAMGVMNLCQGPRSGGTAFCFMHHHVGSPCGVFRPPRTNVGDVLATLRGVQTRDGIVRALVERNGRIAAVALATGEEVPADVVISALDVRRTLVELCDPGWFDPTLVRAANNIRSRGVAARATFEAERELGIGGLTIAPSLDYLERAYDHVKYGRASSEPWIELSAGPSQGGRWHADVHLQYVPFTDDLPDDHARRALEKTLGDLLLRYVPGFSDAALTGLMMPRDMENHCGFPEGQPYFAELALDQALWMRPVPELARYRTPLPGLYLCGPATHPGGSIAGASGANAASVILRDLKKRNKA